MYAHTSPNLQPPGAVSFRVSVRCTYRRRLNEVVPSLLPSCSVMLECAFLLPMKHWLFFVSNGWILLSRSFFCAFYLPFTFRFSFARSSHCRPVLVSISGFEVRIFDFLLEMSLGHQLQSAIIILLVTECRLLSVDLQQAFRLFRLFNLHLAQTIQYAVGWSVSDC